MSYNSIKRCLKRSSKSGKLLDSKLKKSLSNNNLPAKMVRLRKRNPRPQPNRKKILALPQNKRTILLKRAKAPRMANLLI